MKIFLTTLALMLTSCAYTVVKDANGSTRFRTMGNIKKLAYQDETTSIHIEGLNHSTPSAATGKAVSGVAGSVGSIITAGGAGVLIP